MKENLEKGPLQSLEVYDIETLRCLFLYMGYNIQTKEWYIYEVSKYKNDIDALVKHLKDGKIEYAISFNGVGFDAQVLQYILNNYTRWWNLGNLEIVGLIYKFAQKIIDDQKYDLFPPYREEEFQLKQIDLFKIHHFDNENRRTSLKWLEFTMNMENVEEMPIHHTVEKLTEEEIQMIKNYCKNDIVATHQLYLHTIGEVDNVPYKGSSMIQDRVDLIKELNFPAKAISWCDVKIGDEINKKVYKELTGKTDKDLYDMKMNRGSTSGFTYSQCIPDHVEFMTPEFKAFFERMKGVRVNLNDKEEYPFCYNKTTYTIAKGGIHSTEKNRIIECLPGWKLKDADVSSQYPHAIIKRQLFPAHLGKLWLVGYTGNRDKRLIFKNKSSSSKVFKGLADMYKLSLNGGFGKTNERTNWQYDPFVHFRCTIGNQFEILMLIEAMEIGGIHVISANTDGIVSYYPEELDKKYHQICNWWEMKVGNDVQGKLEFAEYHKLVQGSVNDYLAIKDDGKVKKKGDFLTEVDRAFDLNKNLSRRIIPIALEAYFTKGTPVAETIKNHKNIFDFCIGVKASKDYHYETIQDGEKRVYHRLVRYYVAKGGGKLLKIKNDDSEADGSAISQCEAGIWKCIVANQIDKSKAIGEYNIDYNYYIQKAEERILSLESGSKKKKINNNPNQQKLF